MLAATEHEAREFDDLFSADLDQSASRTAKGDLGSVALTKLPRIC